MLVGVRRANPCVAPTSTLRAPSYCTHDPESPIGGRDNPRLGGESTLYAHDLRVVHVTPPSVVLMKADLREQHRPESCPPPLNCYPTCSRSSLNNMSHLQRPLVIQSHIIRLCCPRSRRSSRALFARGTSSRKIHTETVTDNDISRLASLPLHPLTLADLVKYTSPATAGLHAG
jgi:hypothetical protein